MGVRESSGSRLTTEPRNRPLRRGPARHGVLRNAPRVERLVEHPATGTCPVDARPFVRRKRGGGARPWRGGGAAINGVNFFNAR